MAQINLGTNGKKNSWGEPTLCTLRKHATVKFIYSEKATKFCEIFPLLLTTVHTVKSKGKISQNFVAFSEYMNFTWEHRLDVIRILVEAEKTSILQEFHKWYDMYTVRSFKK